MRYPGQHKAISPIIATVLIIAVTIISTAAVSGFVFGILGFYGSSSNSARVAVTSQNLVAATLASGANTATPTCAAVVTANSITLTNTGTSPTVATAMTITYAGTVTTFPITGSCTVTAAGLVSGNPLTITMAATDRVPGAISGQSYTGTVAMSNGAVLIFAGTFN